MDFSPILGQPVPYDGMPNAVSGIASFLLALEQNLSGIGHATPVSVTGATTLTSTAYTKAHVLTGSTYTVTLPTPTASDVGKAISFRASPALTGLVTIDAGATRTIDDTQTKQMIAGDVLTLLCVGTSGMCWAIIARHRRKVAARVYNSANIAVGSASATALTFNSERRDDGTLHDTGSNTDRLTAPVDGWYYLWGNVEYDTNATGFRTTSIRLNSGGTIIAVAQVGAVSGTQTITMVNCPYYLSAGDYVKLFAYQNSGGALNVLADAQFSPEFGMALIDF